MRMRALATLSTSMSRSSWVSVDPVQVLEDHHQRLLEALTDDDAFDRLQRAPASYPRIHHRQRRTRARDTQQAQDVGQRLRKHRVESTRFGLDLLGPATVVVLVGDLEIALQQLDHWQPG